MAARVRLYESRSTVGDISQPTQTADTRVIQAADAFATQEQEATNNLLIEYDKTRTKEAYNTFNESARNKFQELSAREGQTALGKNSVMKEYQSWYDKEYSKIADTLDNTDQQKAFKDRADLKSNHDLDRLSTHEAVELKKYNISVHEGVISDSMADLMLNYGSDNLAEEGEARIRESFADVFPGVDTTKALQKELASYKSLRIQLLADNQQIDKAFKLLEQSKDELKGAYLPLKNQLKETDLTEKSQVAADEIMNNPNLTPEQQYEAAKKYTGKLRDLVEQRVQAAQTDKKNYIDQRKKQDREFHLGQAINIFQDGKSKVEFLDYVSKSVTDPATEKELISYANAIYQRDPNAFDPVAYNDLWREIDAMNQAGTPLSDNEIIIKAVPSMNDTYVQRLIDRNRKQGNVGEIQRSELDTLFKKYTGQEAADRPEASAAFSDYITDQLTPGQKATSVQKAEWAREWFKQEGVGVNEGIFKRNIGPTSRATLITSKDDKNFVPVEALEQIRKIFSDNPEVKEKWIEVYGSEDEAIIKYYKQATKK